MKIQKSKTGFSMIAIMVIAAIIGISATIAIPQFARAVGWYYDNSQGETNWGQVLVNCSHNDSKGNLWTSY